MANPHKIKSLSQGSTAEEYARRFILLPFQPILFCSDDISGIRCSQYFYQTYDSTRQRRAYIDR